MCVSVAFAGGAGQERSRKQFSEYIRESLYVPVRDGTRLAMSIYRPAIEGKAVDQQFPVVFAMTPYRARYYHKDGSIAEIGLSDWLALKGLTDFGYIVAVADIRGKGASFGYRRGFQDRTEAYDGFDLVEWLADQSWSTGNVGMIGCSYLGGAAVQVATTAPPALKAIFAGATDFDKYSFVRRGGITAQFNTRPDEPPVVDLQSVPMDEDKDGSMLKAAVAEHAKNTPMAGLWYGMPYRDSVSEYTGNQFWKEVGPYTYLDKLKASGIATYFWSNWQDEPTEQVLLAAKNVGGKLLVGPGTHCVPPPGFDFSGEVRKYFDYHLKGMKTGLYEEPLYTYLVNDGDDSRWVRSNRLPGEDAIRERFYLTGTGTLEKSPQDKGGSRSFQVNYKVNNKEYFPFWVEPMDDFGLVYTSEPLQKDRLLQGQAMVRLGLKSDKADVNVFAYLEDVAPDGKISVLAFGRLAASHRKETEAPYDMLGMPWHSGRKDDVSLLVPGEKAEMKISLLPASQVIRAGHRLRLVIAGADPRQRNLEQIKQSPAPIITILSGEMDGSYLELPFVVNLNNEQN
ncbi:CocE/NonD family hydrolase [Emcibacter sp.]|uniref:CocE/NonD family hydrolase n=1 Tax=Emcibacter sp. TaxID=1979954 RepID=UPI003A8D87AB